MQAWIIWGTSRAALQWHLPQVPSCRAGQGVLIGPRAPGLSGAEGLALPTGKPPDAIGRLIGKWCNDFGQDRGALLKALGQAQDDPPGDLVEWIGGAARRHNSEPREKPPLTAEEFQTWCDNDPAWQGVQ
jgi:hypothetical protein